MLAGFVDRGAKLALDDFGSGYANFSHLLALPVATVKIDGSLVQNLVQDQNAQRVVAFIASSCQGWYFGKAAPSIPVVA